MTIKSHLESRTKDVTVIDDVVCNKCGKSCFTGFVDDAGKPYINGVTLRERWGYHSNKDQVETNSHICEDCHDEFAASFVIPQIEYDWMSPIGEADQGIPEESEHVVVPKQEDVVLSVPPRLCEVCLEPQFDCPSGVSCKNGHGF